MLNLDIVNIVIKKSLNFKFRLFTSKINVLLTIIFVNMIQLFCLSDVLYINN